MLSKPLMAATIAATMTLFACKKKSHETTPKSTLQYRSLEDVQVKNLQSFHLDIDKDGTHDVYLALGVTMPPGGVSGKFFAAGINGTKLLVKQDTTICLQQDEVMKNVAPHPRDWKGMESYLLEAFIPDAAPQDTVWKGAWVDVSRKYIGVQFVREASRTWVGFVCRWTVLTWRSSCTDVPGESWSEGDLAAGVMPRP